MTKFKIRASGHQGSLTDFIVAQNIDRRHLDATATERALLAKKLKPLYAAEAKERHREAHRRPRSEMCTKLVHISHPDRATDHAAKAAGASRRFLSELETIERNDILGHRRDQSQTVQRRSFRGCLSVQPTDESFDRNVEDIADAKQRGNGDGPPCFNLLPVPRRKSEGNHVLLAVTRLFA